jgi:hypothetical protein
MTTSRRPMSLLASAIKVIAVLEIIGGFGGAALTVWLIFRGAFSLSGVIIMPLIIGIDLLSFVGGIALWRGRTFGRTASLIFQAIQLPKIVSPAVLFMFSFGFDAWVHVLFADDFIHLGFDQKFLVSNQLAFVIPSAPMGFGVSLTAWVYLVMLLKYVPQSGPQEGIGPPAPIEVSKQA